jgi:hypothetical protein
MLKRILILAATVTLTVTPSAVLTMTAEAHTTGIHDNCTKFNKRYPHGVGTRTARVHGPLSPSASGSPSLSRRPGRPLGPPGTGGSGRDPGRTRCRAVRSWLFSAR